MSHETHRINVVDRSREYKWTPRARKVAATLALLGAGLGAAEAASPSTEVNANPASWVAGPVNKVGNLALHGNTPSRTDRIIDSPANIPRGHALTITATNGKGAIALAQEYGAPGHVDDLANEIRHEYVDGQLPAGPVSVYDGFVNPDSLPGAHK